MQSVGNLLFKGKYARHDSHVAKVCPWLNSAKFDLIIHLIGELLSILHVDILHGRNEFIWVGEEDIILGY